MQTLQYNYKTHSYSNESLLLEKGNYGRGNWVLKDKATNKQIDTDQYRNDIAERNNLKLGAAVDTV